MALYLNLFFQMCEGLREIHSKVHYHKDIKPANIFLHGDNGSITQAKIGDFGIARDFSTGGTKTVIEEGTYEYMSPERLNEDEHGREADVWALGVIFFEMINGLHPFYHKLGFRMMNNIILQEPISLPDWVDESIKANIIAPMLQKDPR